MKLIARSEISVDRLTLNSPRTDSSLFASSLVRDAVLDPEIPQALRLQAILRTGIVKIHEKKVSYLHEDAHGALQRLHRVADGADGGDGDGDGDGGEGKVGGGRKRGGLSAGGFRHFSGFTVTR